MSAVSEMPNELLVSIFSHLPLTDLIRCRGVCWLWRDLINNPLCPSITPARRSLLRLYTEALASPTLTSEYNNYLRTRIRPFDREACVNELMRRCSCLPTDFPHTILPDEFVTWILEWPARVLIGGMWPGLQRELARTKLGQWNEFDRLNPCIVASGSSSKDTSDATIVYLRMVSCGPSNDVVCILVGSAGMIDDQCSTGSSGTVHDMTTIEKRPKKVRKWMANNTFVSQSWVEYLESRLLCEDSEDEGGDVFLLLVH